MEENKRLVEKKIKKKRKTDNSRTVFFEVVASVRRLLKK
jgi:hypothetical protein